MRVLPLELNVCNCCLPLHTSRVDSIFGQQQAAITLLDRLNPQQRLNAMKVYKKLIPSQIFKRLAHADIFEIGKVSDVPNLYIFFGGSGIEESVYQERAKTFMTLFDSSIARLEQRNINAVLVFVTSPYDVSFDQIASDSELAQKFERHVLQELCSQWQNYKFYLMAFSGGAALALNGLHRHPNCRGAALFGADQFPLQWMGPESWRHPVQLFCARDDRVCSAPATLSRFKQLEKTGQVEWIECASGGHSLKNYIDSFFLQAFYFAETCF